MRTLVVVAVTAAGLLAGGMLDLVWVATGGPAAPVVTLGLGLAGLLLGLVVAAAAFPRPRRRLDPGRYPNRVIRRR